MILVYHFELKTRVIYRLWFHESSSYHHHCKEKSHRWIIRRSIILGRNRRKKVSIMMVGDLPQSLFKTFAAKDGDHSRECFASGQGR
jgi:hypothetical protein